MSQTIKQQQQVIKALKQMHGLHPTSLFKQAHSNYMIQNLIGMGKSIRYFDYGHPWIYFYIINTTSLLNQQLPQQLQSSIIQALSYCWNQKTGGFGGGYKQLPHLAPTYAAVLTILNLGKPAYKLLNKQGLQKFFWSCKQNKQFQMTPDAEFDLRGAYIVVIIVKLLHLDEAIIDGITDSILASQTYQGGLSNVIGGEAHGGYTFCGVAALSLLGKLQNLDIPRLMLWLNHRQSEFGGFSGRTNKLLDSCYSFWVGAIFNIVNNYFDKTVSVDSHLLYSEQALQQYIIFYCQNSKGGLWDKPGKSRDIYHTCYALSGLSQSQQNYVIKQQDRIKQNDPIYNVPLEKLKQAQQYFDTL